MKNSIALKILMVLILSIFTNHFITLAQMTKWYVAPKIVTVSAGNGNPSVANMSGTPPTAASFANSIYDPNGSGALLFYIADGIFYNPNNTFFTGTGIGNTLHTTEISVVPFNCEGGKYHIFHLAANELNGFDLIYSIADITSGSGTINYVSTVANFASGNAAGIAAGDLKSCGKRYIYALSGSTTPGVGSIIRITINADNTLNTASTIVTGATSGFGSVYFDCVEADLSNDGTKLAWASVYNDKAYVISLTENGTYGGSVSTYTTGTSTDFFGRGVEFNAAGTELYVGAGNAGIKRVTFSGGAVNSVTGTGNYGNSQLEKGTNGFIYALHKTSNLIIGINPGTYSLTSTATTQRPFENYYSLLTMPDQIDGFNYGNLPSSFNATTHTATTQTWTSGTNPWSANIVRIKNSLTVPSGVTLTIRNMTVEFGLGATLNVQSGGTLRLEKATLQSACSLNMWQGIIVNGTGQVVMTNYGLLTYSTIYDAIIGIELNGTSAKATINSLSYFERNETHVKINNGGTQNTFITSYYNHQQPLKEQCRGLDQNGGTGTPRYGIKSFDIINSSNTQIIGGATSGYGNWFNEGQYGIHAVNSNTTSLRNTFNTLRTRAIVLNGQWGSKSLNVTTSNTFNNCRRAIDSYFGTNLTVRGNTFNSGTEHGIAWAYNPGKILIIGDDANSALGNTFTGQNWSAVIASDNADTLTEISIGYNTIQNAAWAGGIYVQESSGQTARTYKKMHIVKNDINNVGDPITVNNVWGIGSAHAAAQITDDPNPTFKINNNDIDFNTAYGSNKSGIKVSNSRFVRSRFNNVATTSNWTWGNRGIHYSDSRYSLIEKNYCKAASGVEMSFDMLHSNIDCNTLDYCMVGIELAFEQLRTGSNDYHGETTELNRINYFSNSLVYDMDLYYSYPNFNKWVEPNTTSINYNPYTGNIIVNGGSNRCHLLADYEMLMGGGNEEQSYDNSEHDPLWFEAFPETENNWSIIYHEQAEQNADENGLLLTSNPFIPAVLHLEKLLSEANFETAREIWEQLTPQHPFEVSLKDVYEVILAYRPEEPRKLTEGEIKTLVTVAEQSPLEAGPAVYSARAILKFKENMDFYDATPAPIQPYESGKTDETTNTFNLQFAAYPVPAKEMLTLLSGIEGITYYKIVSIDGRIVVTGAFTSRFDYNAQRLSSGTYYLEMTDETGNALYRKLISKQ